MSTATGLLGLSGGNVGGGVPVGSFVDFTSEAPNIVTTETETYMRSGITALASLYPKVPSSLVGTVYNAEVVAFPPGQRTPLPYLNCLTGGLNSLPAKFKMAANGNNIIGFPAGFTSEFDLMNCGVYCRSTDGGATYEYLVAPWVNDVTNDSYPARLFGCVGLFYVGTRFICIINSGDVYSSTDNGSSWVKSASTPFSGTTGRAKLVNGRIFIMPCIDGPFSNAGIVYGSPTQAARVIQNIASPLIHWSADGLTWTTVDVGVTAQWTDIAHTGSVYVMVSGTNTVRRCVATGDPTTTWVNGTTTVPNNTYGAPPLSVITSFGTMLVATSQGVDAKDYGYYMGYARHVYHSSNGGDSWTLVTLNTQDAQGAMQNSFLFDGTTLWLRSNKIYKSTNGTTWTEHTSLGTVDRISGIPDDLVLVNGAWHGITQALPFSGGVNTSYLISFFNYTSTANLYTTATIVDQVADGLCVENVAVKDAMRVMFPGVPDSKSGSSVVIGANGGTGAGGMNRYCMHLSGQSWAAYFLPNPQGYGMFRRYLYSLDSGTTWQYGQLPYLAAWMVADFGQSGDLYTSANGSVGTATINYSSQSTIVNDRGVYKTSNLTSWTKTADLQTGCQPLRFFTDPTRGSTGLVTMDWTGQTLRFFSSVDGGVTWVSVHTTGALPVVNGYAYFRLSNPVSSSNGGVYVGVYSRSNTTQARIVFSRSVFSPGRVSHIPLTSTVLGMHNYGYNILHSVSITNSGKIFLTFALGYYQVTNGQGSYGSIHMAVSNDFGVSWTAIPLSSIDAGMAVDTSTLTNHPIFGAYDISTGKLFIRYRNKLVVSADDGNSYTLLTNQRNIPALPTSASLSQFLKSAAVTGMTAAGDVLSYTVTGVPTKILSNGYIKNAVFASPIAGVVKYMRVD